MRPRGADTIAAGTQAGSTSFSRIKNSYEEHDKCVVPPYETAEVDAKKSARTLIRTDFGEWSMPISLITQLRQRSRQALRLRALQPWLHDQPTQ
jgi:hypothetical protein